MRSIAGVAAQRAEFGPALAGIVICTLAAAAFALVWLREIDLLTDAVRQVPPRSRVRSPDLPRGH